MSQNKSKSIQKKLKDSSKLSTTLEKNNFSVAEEVYCDEPEKLEKYKKQREQNDHRCSRQADSTFLSIVL